MHQIISGQKFVFILYNLKLSGNRKRGSTMIARNNHCANSGLTDARNCVLHHRTTLIERSCGGDPGWAQAWSQVERNFPDWPGLRPERSDPALADELERGRARALRECEALKRWARRYCPDADHR